MAIKYTSKVNELGIHSTDYSIIKKYHLVSYLILLIEQNISGHSNADFQKRLIRDGRNKNFNPTLPGLEPPTMLHGLEIEVRTNQLRQEDNPKKG